MISLRELTVTFARIGALSFGGPAAQIALMHRVMVEERCWLNEAQFLRALSFCMMLPGPEAMQLCTWCGWRMRGVAGGLIAGGLFVLPGAFVIGLLAVLYAVYGDLPLARQLFTGVQAVVVVVVVQAIIRLAGKALRSGLDLGLALASFVALFGFQVPFPLVVGTAAGIGAFWARVRDGSAGPERRSARLDWRVSGLFALLWVAPLAGLALTGQTFLLELGLFFAKLAVVTFGGAYAVLTYMTQEVVVTHGWLTTGQMMDALGLAETTPGPLILVTQFVGHLAGHGQGMMLIAGLLTLWVTFMPCFLWIFAGAPLIDRLEHMPRLAAALHGITAAVVGVIANLSVWFAAHVLFTQVGEWQAGPLRLIAPAPGSLSLTALALVTLAALLLRRLPLPAVLALVALAGLGGGLWAG